MTETFSKRFYQDVVKLSFYKYYTTSAGVDHWKCNVSIGAGIVQELGWKENDVISINLEGDPHPSKLLLFKKDFDAPEDSEHHLFKGHKLKKANKSYFYTIRFSWKMMETGTILGQEIKYGSMKVPSETIFLRKLSWLVINYREYFKRFYGRFEEGEKG